MWQTISILDVLEKLDTSENQGLSEVEAKKRLNINGKNILKEKAKVSFILKFLNQFKDCMVLILIGASVISALIEYVNKTNDYFDSIIIIGIVVMNALMGVIQESKAEKAIESLKNMFAPGCTVIRDGKTKQINASDVVVGDIVCLESGMIVPADLRLISSTMLQLDESTLTGETNGVQKDSKKILGKISSLGDNINMAYASTIVVSGRGKGVVVETGEKTEVGKIANLLIDSKEEMTPLQLRLNKIGKILGIVATIICVIIFILGTIKKIPVLEMFMTSVGLAVAAIPEGLPAVVTIILSIGVSKMAKHRAIIRKLAAVETLGCSSVICSDKTGTLTENKMKVVDMYGEQETIKYASLCTNVKMDIAGKFSGMPTEVAIYDKAMESGINCSVLQNEYIRVKEIPFDSRNKYMTVICKKGSQYLVITKGAPDVLVPKFNVSNQKDKEILSVNDLMAKKALRVIAVGYKICSSMPTGTEQLDFLGLIAMEDPPKRGVREAILDCKRAGIKVVMITGDHITTARAIAENLGICSGNQDECMTGKQLDELSDRELAKSISKYSVFARVTPEHKVKIVKAFKQNGKVVAMTGDGVNDAPALKSADIGVAMGKSGTDVAKNAADMVLTDDNFTTIVEAVKEGRHIYSNIKKAIHFLISTNVGEIVVVFLALLLNLDSPLLAIHLLWINLVTDSFPAIALGLEKCDKNIMRKKPIDKKKGLFSDGLWTKIFFQGTFIGILALLLFVIGNKLYGLEVARTMTFMGLGFLELAHSFNVRSEEALIKHGIASNIYILVASMVGILMQVFVISFSALASAFDVVQLTKPQWLIVAMVSVLPIIISEIKKSLFLKSEDEKIDVQSFIQYQRNKTAH